jgi:Ca2+-binding RTX toxin-like protein
VTKLAPDGASLAYSTFLGGRRFDFGYAIAVDGAGAASVTGGTESDDFPATPGAFDTTHNGHGDAFVTKLAPDGASLAYSTFLGGGSFEGGAGIAMDGSGAAYLTGHTDSVRFPTTPGAFDRTLGGLFDGFVTKLAIPPTCTITGTAGSDAIAGTSGDDVICARAGFDVVQAKGGNDLVFGGPNGDTLVGGAGNDTLRGGPGSDVLRTTDGVDVNDLAVGGPGEDLCIIDGGDRTTGCETVEVR